MARKLKKHFFITIPAHVFTIAKIKSTLSNGFEYHHSKKETISAN